ncbi:MAG: signal peptidase II [Rhizomicrobium sp.]
MLRISSYLTKPRLIAASAIVAAAALDITIKRLVLAHDWDDRVLIPGLAETHYARNHGVSFNLFWQSGAAGSAVLALLLAGIILIFAAMAFRTSKPIVAGGLGLIVGGALGNMVDRLSHGAVFDFLVLRLGAWPLFVCNPADIFISLGVLLLALDTILTGDDPKPA